jgi:predicted permease
VPLKIKFIVFQLVIILPFITGYISRRFIRNREDTAKKIIRINLLSIEPLIVLWSIWGLTLSSDQIFLPLSGLSLAIAGFLIGTITILFTDRKDTGRKTYLISSSLANHGFTMGGFICYLIAGEQGEFRILMNLLKRQ